MSEYTIQELRAMHIMSKPILKKAVKKTKELLREETMSHRAQVTISRLAMSCESYDEVIDTLLVEIDRLNSREKVVDWAIFKCEECQAGFAIKEDKAPIDEPICPVCSSDNVRDGEGE